MEEERQLFGVVLTFVFAVVAVVATYIFSGGSLNPLKIFRKKYKIHSEKDESGRVAQIQPLMPGQNSVIRGFILPEKENKRRNV